MKLFTLFCATLLTTSAITQINVGIGTNTPTYPLTVIAVANKGMTQKTGTVEIGFYTSANGAFLQTWSNHPLSFGTNSSEPQLTLTSYGYLGVGTTAPTQSLDVAGALRLQGGNPAAGRILNAIDGNGNVEWKPMDVSGTKTMFVPYVAFAGSSEWMGHINENNVSRRASGWLNNTYNYQAPLLLPVGTVIKEITWYYFDNNVSLNLDFALLKENYGYPAIVSETSSGGALNVDWSRNVTVNHTLENTFYWLDISCFSWSSDASLRFKGALITYE